MRMHLITAAGLLVAPWAGALAAQDTTQAQKQTQMPDTVREQTRNDGMGMSTALDDNAVLSKMHETNQMEIRVGRLAQRNGSSAKVKSFGAKLVRDHTAADQKVVALSKKLGMTLAQGPGMDSTAGKYGEGRRGQRGDTTQTMGSRQGRDSTYQQGNQRNDTTYRQGNQRNDSTYRQGYQGNDSTSRQGYQRNDSTQSQSQNPDYMNRGEHRGEMDHAQLMQQLQTQRGAAFDTTFATAMVQGHQKAINMLEQAQTQVQQNDVRTLITSTLPTLREHLRIAQSLTNAYGTTSSSQ